MLSVYAGAVDTTHRFSALEARLDAGGRTEGFGPVEIRSRRATACLTGGFAALSATLFVGSLAAAAVLNVGQASALLLFAAIAFLGAHQAFFRTVVDLRVTAGGMVFLGTLGDSITLRLPDIEALQQLTWR